MTTTRVAVLDRVLELIAGHPNISTTKQNPTGLLSYPRPPITVGMETIHGGDIRAVIDEPAGFTGPPNSIEMRDDFALDLWVVVTRPGKSPEQARRRAGELVDAIVATVCAFPRLDRDQNPHAELAGVLAVWVSSIDGPHCDIGTEGYLGMARVELTALSIITTAI